MRQMQRNRRPIFLMRWVGFHDETAWTREPAEHIEHTATRPHGRMKTGAPGRCIPAARAQAD
jgi:hypothetical protein